MGGGGGKSSTQQSGHLASSTASAITRSGTRRPARRTTRPARPSPTGPTRPSRARWCRSSIGHDHRHPQVDRGQRRHLPADVRRGRQRHPRAARRAATSSAAISQDYMNPYVENVVDRAIDNAERSGRLAHAQHRDQTPCSKRAFGGSRQAIQEACAGGRDDARHRRPVGAAAGEGLRQGRRGAAGRLGPAVPEHRQPEGPRREPDQRGQGGPARACRPTISTCSRAAR